MSKALKLILRRDFLDRYPTPWALAGELIALLASLTIYWYTAQAFAPRLNSAGGDYFSYLLIGELTLFVPIVLFECGPRMVRQYAADGTLEALLVMPVRPQLPLILQSAAGATRALIRCFLTLVLAAAVFGFSTRLPHLVAAFVFQLAGLPVFLGLGLLGAGIILRFGRGDSMLTYAGTAAAVLAGAYFPTSVLPSALQTLSGFGSPFTALLEGTRAVWSSGWNFSSARQLGILLVWGACLLPISYLFLGYGFRFTRQKGAPFIFTS